MTYSTCPTCDQAVPCRCPIEPERTALCAVPACWPTKHQHATPAEIEAARAQYGSDEIEIDDHANVSRADGNPDGGCWVAAWVWVADEECSDKASAPVWDRSACTERVCVCHDDSSAPRFCPHCGCDWSSS